MRQPTEDDLHRARLLNEDRIPKRLIKRFKSLADSKPTDGTDIPQAELEALHAAFISDLSLFFLSLNQKSTRLVSNSHQDAQSYLDSLQTMSQSQTQTHERIAALTDTLAQAQRTRANKLEYDALALKINALSSRSQQAETITRLEGELAELNAEAQNFKDVWSRRKSGFDGIVDVLQEIGRDVAEEKSEQERRQAMDEEGEDGDAATQTANQTAAQSKEGTPNGDAEGEREETEEGAQSEAEADIVKKALNPTAREFTPDRSTSQRPQAMDVDEVEEGEMAD